MKSDNSAERTEKLFWIIFTLVIELIGYAFLLFADWRIALGVFMIHWGINLSALTKEN